MAQVTQLSRHLQLQFQAGTTTKGAPKLQNHNYQHLSPSISEDDALSVGQALGALFGQPMYQVAIVEQNALASDSTASSTQGA
jgi:hypothetical protein